MNRRNLGWLVTALLSLLCSSLQAQQAATPMPLSYSRTAPTAEAALHKALPVPKVAAAHSLSLSSDLPDSPSDKQLESLRNHGPWLTQDGLSDNAQALIRHIQNSRVHGLNPEAYHLASILRVVDTLLLMDRRQSFTPDVGLYANEQGQQQPTGGAASSDALESLSVNPASEKPSTPAYFANAASTQSDKDYLAFRSRSNNPNADKVEELRQQLNTLLDKSFIKLSRHLGQGVVNGRKLQNRLYRNAPRLKPLEKLQSIKSGLASVDASLNDLAQQHPTYLRMTRRMRDLLTENASGVGRSPVAAELPSGDNARHHDNIALQHRLFETGDLAPDDLFALEAEDALDKAIKEFQSRHGISVTGIADKRTRQKLNRSVVEEITDMAINLERWRWLPRNLGDKHIFVNIPDYRVVVKENHETLLSMPAVVGKRKNQTPSFSQEMSYMEFNPTWTVPHSIAQKELIPRERRRPGYLVSRQFEFLKRIDNQLIKVPSSSVTREDFNKPVFPYLLQQRGGPINALGKMKFMMPNPYAIYLHDTQAKKHFTLNDRAYSHGCIRLSEPATLARLLLEGDGKQSSIVDNALRSAKTKRVRLRKPVPTHLVYLTTWVDENDVIQYRNDMYLNNQSLIDALKKSNTLVSIMNT